MHAQFWHTEGRRVGSRDDWRPSLQHSLESGESESEQWGEKEPTARTATLSFCEKWQASLVSALSDPQKYHTKVACCLVLEAGKSEVQVSTHLVSEWAWAQRWHFFVCIYFLKKARLVPWQLLKKHWPHYKLWDYHYFLKGSTSEFFEDLIATYFRGRTVHTAPIVVH